MRSPKDPLALPLLGHAHEIRYGIWNVIGGMDWVGGTFNEEARLCNSTAPTRSLPGKARLLSQAAPVALSSNRHPHIQTVGVPKKGVCEGDLRASQL